MSSLKDLQLFSIDEGNQFLLQKKAKKSIYFATKLLNLKRNTKNIPFWQYEQINFRSAVWFRICVNKDAFRANVLEHNVQVPSSPYINSFCEFLLLQFDCWNAIECMDLWIDLPQHSAVNVPTRRRAAINSNKSLWYKKKLNNITNTYRFSSTANSLFHSVYHSFARKIIIFSFKMLIYSY